RRCAFSRSCIRGVRLSTSGGYEACCSDSTDGGLHGHSNRGRRLPGPSRSPGSYGAVLRGRVQRPGRARGAGGGTAPVLPALPPATPTSSPSPPVSTPAATRTPAASTTTAPPSSTTSTTMAGRPTTTSSTTPAPTTTTAPGATSTTTASTPVSTTTSTSAPA